MRAARCWIVFSLASSLVGCGAKSPSQPQDVPSPAVHTTEANPLPPPPETAEPSAKKGDPRFVGRWVCEPNQFQKFVGTFLPDGRYGVIITTAGVEQAQQARYWVEGEQLVFHFLQEEQPRRFAFTLEGNRLTVRGTPVGDIAYEKQAGSEQQVVEEARQADAAKTKEDERWRAKFASARLTKQPPHVPVGEVPADPRPQHIFDRPTVFTGPQLYVRELPQEYIYANGIPPGIFKTHWHWHFLATGRLYVVAVTYTGSTKARERESFWGTYYVNGKNELKQWGRYRLGEQDSVEIEYDDGSQAALRLLDGRRNLLWGQSVYGNIVWELEALKQYQRKQGK